MKKINFFTLLVAGAVSVLLLNAAPARSATKAKGKPYIEAFDEGRVLTKTDIKFLNSITNGTADYHEVTVSNKKYKPGQRINSNEAAVINYAKSVYRKKHHMEKAEDARAIDRAHGTRETCYWYNYCDDNSNCYYVWYTD